MNLQLSRQSILCRCSLLVLTLFVAPTATLAQGVSPPLVTFHSVDPGPVVNIGSAATPIQVDWDGAGLPWSKNVGDPNNNVMGVTTMDMFETIKNVGTEAWTDWHEILLPPPVGLVPPHWTSVVNLTINGNPITYTATGIGTQNLDLFNFSQSVMPGDVFGIHKKLQVDGSIVSNGAFLRIQEYPTVPEPATIVLIVMSGLALAGIRRHR